MKIVAYEFRDVPYGSLVEYSDHWQKETGSRKRKIGLVVDKSFFEGDKCGMPGVAVACWPSVWWEGAPINYLCHPCNVRPKRKHLRQMFEYDDGRPA